MESVIELGHTPKVKSYTALSDDVLRRYLQSKATASKEVATIDGLDKLVETHLRIDTTNADVRSVTEKLFLSYKLLLCCHGLT